MASMPKILQWGPYDDWKGWLRGLIIALAAADLPGLWRRLRFGRRNASGSARLLVRPDDRGLDLGRFRQPRVLPPPRQNPAACGCGS